MNQTTVDLSIEGTLTHPYVAEIVMDPVNWSGFQRTFDGRPEVQQLGVDRSVPDKWRVFVACSSRAIKELLESNW
jgi:hypothetical protein